MWNLQMFHEYFIRNLKLILDGFFLTVDWIVPHLYITVDKSVCQMNTCKGSRYARYY